jgi:hypothetical protein
MSSLRSRARFSALNPLSLLTASMLQRLVKEHPQSPLEDLLVSRLVADWEP